MATQDTGLTPSSIALDRSVQRLPVFCRGQDNPEAHNMSKGKRAVGPHPLTARRPFSLSSSLRRAVVVGIHAGELRGEVAMSVRSQARMCAADVHSRHTADTFELLGTAQVSSMSVFAAGQAGDSSREWRRHRTRHPQPASGRDDAREVACEAERRCDHVADRGVGVQLRLDVDVRIALAHLHPRLRRRPGPARRSSAGHCAASQLCRTSHHVGPMHRTNACCAADRPR